MSETKKVKVIKRIGDPKTGVILQPGAVVDLPAFWAERHIAEGRVEEVKAAKPAAKPKKGK